MSQSNEPRPEAESEQQDSGAEKAASRKSAPRRKTPARRQTDSAPTKTKQAASGIGSGTRGKVLVTGAAGALAQHVIALLREHYDVVGVEFRGVQAEYPDTVDYVVDFNTRPFEDVFREHDFMAIRLESSNIFSKTF